MSSRPLSTHENPCLGHQGSILRVPLMSYEYPKEVLVHSWAVQIAESKLAVQLFTLFEHQIRWLRLPPFEGSGWLGCRLGTVNSLRSWSRCNSGTTFAHFITHCLFLSSLERWCEMWTTRYHCVSEVIIRQTEAETVCSETGTATSRLWTMGSFEIWTMHNIKVYFHIIFYHKNIDDTKPWNPETLKTIVLSQDGCTFHN